MLDLIIKAGPRALRPDVPVEVRQEIAKSEELRKFREVATATARIQQAKMHAELKAVGRDNERAEFKAANGLGTLHARVPQMVIEHMRALYGDDCWSDEAFVEDFLKHHPECRVKTTRGTKGQEYGPPTPTRLRSNATARQGLRRGSSSREATGEEVRGRTANDN